MKTKGFSQIHNVTQEEENFVKEKNVKMDREIQDRKIVVKIQSGEKEAFGLVYDIYIEPIYRFIFFKVSSEEIAQDLTSECFLRVFRYIVEKKKKIVSLRALLYRTARNCVIDHYRKKSRHEVPYNEEIEEKVDAKQESLEDVVDIQIELTRIKHVIYNLKNEWQEVIILRYIEEYDNQEIAEILEKSEGAIRTMLHRALQELRRQLSE